MSQIIPIYIPTYISSQTYAPARVLPRLFYYNGLVDCETWYLESGSLNEAGYTYEQTSFPYFDNYGVVTGSFPTAGSPSLLFNNETPSYGELPTGSLFTQYWDTYISLLYNPRTRLLNCSAIIPLADYVKMELNDIVNFRGNYYHLRAINNYSLKTGKCDLQLLGPIIADTFSSLEPAPEPPSTSSYAEVSWSFTESGGANGNFRVYDNGSNIATLTANGSGNQRIDTGHIVNAEMYPVSWVAGVSMSINVNGATTIATSSSIDNTISSSFTATSGSVYYITGSINDSNAPCCSPQITGFAINGSNLEISFSTGSTCAACSNTTVQSSVDNSTWGGSNTGACVSPRSITAPTSSLYYRVNMDCGFASTNGSSSYYNFSDGITKTTTSGTYVVSGGSSTAAGQLTNNTGVTLYIYGYFISGGDTTGDVSSDSGTVSSTNLTFTGTISGSGQQIYSTNYHTLSSDNTPVSWSLSKQDGLTNGSTMRLAYATTIGGTITDIS
jgi:hypothetical protein